MLKFAENFRNQFAHLKNIEYLVLIKKSGRQIILIINLTFKVIYVSFIIKGGCWILKK